MEFALKIGDVGKSLSSVKGTIKKEISISKTTPTRNKTIQVNNKHERELEKIRAELQKEKENLAKAKQEKQMKLSDTPKKIKIEKKS